MKNTNGWRYRGKGRHRKEAMKSNSKANEETGMNWNEHYGTKSHANRRQFLRTKKQLSLTATAVVLFVVLIIYQIQDYIDEQVQDKYWRAMLLLPMRYLRVKLMDQRPTGPKTFTLKHDRSFVINLDADKERWRDFQESNQKQVQNITRFSATSLQTKNDDKREHYYLEEYNFLRNLIRKEGKGSAACAISHLKLLSQFVANTTNDDEYVFVFEDDAVLISQLLNLGFVIGPDNADFILLTEYSSAHIRVTFDRNHVKRNLKDVSAKTMEENYAESINTAVRVVSGYSAMGYVITRRGAKFVLDGMKREKDLPVDVFFFANPQIKAYLPMVSWPVVQHHQPYLSVRRDKNKQR